MNLDLPGVPPREWLNRKDYVVFICIFLASLVQLYPLLKISPTIVRGDGVGYYAYLRSLFFDYDVDFGNEYRYFESVLPEDSQPLTTTFLHSPRTETGYLHNHWPVGPAILWFPFFLVGHIAARLAVCLGRPVVLDGYSLPYQLGIAVGSVVYAFTGLMLVYRLCRERFSTAICLLSLLLVWFGTSLTAYMYFMPSMSHAVSFFCSSAFIYTWYRTRHGRSLAAWGGLGMLGGLVALQRLQDGIFVLMVAIELGLPVIGWARERRWRQFLGLLVPGLVFVAGLVLTFLPQIITWQVLYGKVAPNVYQESVGLGFDWLHPRIVAVLFSSRHGLLSWTPLLAFGLAGLVLLYRSDRILTLALATVFLLQLYIISCWPYWYQGASFGGRMFVSSLPMFILGLAALIEWLGKTISWRWIALVGSVFVLWNYVLLYQYGTGMISRDAAVYWPQVIKNVIVIAARFVDTLTRLFS